MCLLQIPCCLIPELGYISCLPFAFRKGKVGVSQIVLCGCIGQRMLFCCPVDEGLLAGGYGHAAVPSPAFGCGLIHVSSSALRAVLRTLVSPVSFSIRYFRQGEIGYGKIVLHGCILLGMAVCSVDLQGLMDCINGFFAVIPAPGQHQIGACQLGHQPCIL